MEPRDAILVATELVARCDATTHSIIREMGLDCTNSDVVDALLSLDRQVPTVKPGKPQPFPEIPRFETREDECRKLYNEMLRTGRWYTKRERYDHHIPGTIVLPFERSGLLDSIVDMGLVRQVTYHKLFKYYQAIPGEWDWDCEPKPVQIVKEIK